MRSSEEANQNKSCSNTFSFFFWHINQIHEKASLPLKQQGLSRAGCHGRKQCCALTTEALDRPRDTPHLWGADVYGGIVLLLLFVPLYETVPKIRLN